MATVAAASTNASGELISGYRLSFLVATGLIVLAGITITISRKTKTP